MLQDLLKASGSEFATLVEDSFVMREPEYIDTGSYTINALLSGTIHGGYPTDRITAIHGESQSGKSFLALEGAANWLAMNPQNVVIYMDSEAALNKSAMRAHNIDPKRFGVISLRTVEDFRTITLRVVGEYVEKYKKLTAKQKREGIGRPLIILDSLGNLSTKKEIGDIAKGEDIKDMTRSQLIRGAFRVITTPLGFYSIPMLVTNHVYVAIGTSGGKNAPPPNKAAGGGGIAYGASNILELKKTKERVSKTDYRVIGARIRARLDKGRGTIEQKMVESLIYFDRGLDRYAGLLTIAQNHGLFQADGNRIVCPDGTKQFGITIMKNPEKYFTPDVLEQIDGFCAKEFLYQSGDSTDDGEDVDLKEFARDCERANDDSMEDVGE